MTRQKNEKLHQRNKEYENVIDSEQQQIQDATETVQKQVFNYIEHHSSTTISTVRSKIINFRWQASNIKCEKELDQNKRKNKHEFENLIELNTKLEEKLKACARDNDLLSSDLGLTSDRLR